MSNNKSKDNKLKCDLAQPLLSTAHPVIPIKILPIHESGSQDEVVGQCPGCKTPYVKDKGCLHVKCLKDACRIDFCFQCSCIRSPTMAHGNHFHRQP